MSYYLAPRIKLSKKSKKFGYPIYLRFSYRGEEAWLPTEIKLKEKDFWNDEIKMVVGGPLIQSRNKVIAKALLDAEERINKAILEGEGPTIKAFKGKTLESFEEYIKQVDKTSHRDGLIKQMKKFNNDKVPNIEQITIKWLRQFEDFLEGKQGLAYNSMVGYIAVVRKVLNQAVKEGYITKSPIGKGLYEAPTPKRTEARYLVDEERLALVNALLNNKVEGIRRKVLAYLLLGCHTGLRYSDWDAFRYDLHVRAGVIVLRAKKNKADITMPIEPDSTLDKILKIIKELGPLDISYHQVLNYLDDIEKEFKLAIQLTTHVGRHSFGYLCASIGVAKNATAYYMGITIRTVDVYYHLTGKHIEEQSKQLRTV